jgi:DNA helicase II / ATP-dependent DNA helicase PcrA
MSQGMRPPAGATAWYANRLSPEQGKGVSAAVQSSAILASAGSGKTRTLVCAVADEILRGTPPENIVAFTFTKKAAQELLTRVHFLVREVAPDKDYSAISVGTIHSWCLNYLLKQESFYNFSALDEDVQVYALISRLYDYLELEKAYGKKFPDAILPFIADLEVFYNEHIAIGDVPLQIRPSVEKFEQALAENRLLTFGSMVRYATQHLKANGPASGLKKLFVDEYQDVNPSQVQLIHAMLGPDSQVVVVGDDLQCIYNWRGSDVTRIINFATEFHTPPPAILSENYRSRPRIVQFCNDVASNISVRYPKSMAAKNAATTASGVFHHSFGDELEQAKGIAELVTRFHANGVPYSSIAILLRSVTSAGIPVMDALTARSVPVSCPLQRQCGSFIDSFVMPLLQWLQTDNTEPKNEQEESAAERRISDIWESVKPWLSGPAKAPHVFWRRIGQWFSEIQKNSSAAYNVRGQLYEFLTFCGIRLSTSDTQLAVALGITSQIIRAVEEIHRRRLVGSPRKSAKGVMREVYYGMRDFKDILGESYPVEAPGDAVVVTTVHQSKGLEWPVVIIATLNKNRFPLRNAAHTTSFDPTITLRYGTTEEDEWRLFYVAASRAKERLFLFDFANSNPQKQSLFLHTLHAALHRAKAKHLDWNDKAVTLLIKQELQVSDPPTLRLGLSDVLIYAECPYQYALRRIVGIQPPIADTLGYGQSIHEIAQRRANGGSEWSEQELAKAVDNFVHLPYVGERQLAESKAAIHRRVQSLQKAGAFNATSEPEVNVEVSFPQGIVVGVVDSIVSTKNGKAVRDWKTNIHTEFITRYEEQLRFYTHALREKGHPIETSEMIDVGSTHESGELRSFSVDVSATSVAMTVKNIDAALSGIASREFEPTPSRTICSGCDVKTICAYNADNEEAKQTK